MPREPEENDLPPPGKENVGGNEMTACVGSYNPQKLLEDILQKLVQRGDITPEEAQRRLEQAGVSFERSN